MISDDEMMKLQKSIADFDSKCILELMIKYDCKFSEIESVVVKYNQLDELVWDIDEKNNKFTITNTRRIVDLKLKEKVSECVNVNDFITNTNVNYNYIKNTQDIDEEYSEDFYNPQNTYIKVDGGNFTIKYKGVSYIVKVTNELIKFSNSFNEDVIYLNILDLNGNVIFKSNIFCIGHDRDSLIRNGDGWILWVNDDNKVRLTNILECYYKETFIKNNKFNISNTIELGE
jgi:hypothetical protein